MRRTLILLMLLNSKNIYAAGYGTALQGANGMGSAYAGIAASAQDATTIYANPAGMTYLKGSQFVGSSHLVRPESRFEDEGSVKALGISPKGGEGGDIGRLMVIPNFFYAKKLSENVALGLGINSPFGLKTEYEDDWIGRFQTVKSQLKTININPAFAYKLSERLSLGAGISAMYGEVELNRAVNRVTRPESEVTIKGDDWGWGYNLGLIYQITDRSRLGLAYRSRVNLDLDGTAKFEGALAAANTGVQAQLVTPESLALSSFSQINDDWQLLSEVTWTRWSRFKAITVVKDDGSILTDLPQNWSNSLRYSIGAAYRVNQAFQLRSGVAYDREVISDDFRQARIPSNHRTWLSVGATWFRSEDSKLDVAYTHIFVQDASIEQLQNTAASGYSGNLIGSYQAQVNMLAIQFTRYLQ